MPDWSFLPRWLGGGVKRQPGIQSPYPAAAFTGAQYRVDEQTALMISAVWAAVQLKATTLASLGLDFYRMTDGGREAYDSHPLAVLFRGKVNRYQTRMEFFETLGLNLYLSGNAYILKQKQGNKIVGLLPLMSSQVEVELMRDGSLVYTHTDGINVTAYGEDSIWHIRLIGNGVKGLSPLQYARQSIGLAIAGEDWASKLVGNGGKPTGVLTYDRILTPDQREQLRGKFKDLREGTADALIVLEAGMKYEQVSLSPQDVQLLEARRFQVEDIARFFNVPSVLINDTAGSTVWGSGIEQIITGWYKLQFRSELERVEDSIKANLLTPAEYQAGRVDCEFNFEELLRTDFKTRVETGARAVGAGLMSRNEWRKREWLPEVEGADELTAQVNLSPLEDLAKVVGGNAPRPVEDKSQPITVNAHIGLPEMHIKTPISVNLPEHKSTFEMAPQEIKFHMEPPQVSVNVEPTPVEVRAEANVDMSPVVTAVGKGSQAVRDAVREAMGTAQKSADELKGAVDGVRAEVGKPTKAVFDKDGNPIGAKRVDRL